MKWLPTWSLLVLSSMSFALCTAFAKACGKHVPTLEKVFFRSFFTSLVLLLPSAVPSFGTMGPKNNGSPSLVSQLSSLTTSQRLVLVRRGTCGFIALFCYFEGASVLPLGTLTVITRFHPVLSALLSDGVTADLAVVLVLSVLGVLLVASPALFVVKGAQTEIPPFGLGLAVTAVVFTSAAFISIRKANLLEIPAQAIIFSFHAVATPVSFLLGYQTFVLPSLWELSLLVGTAVTMQAAQLCQTELLKRRTVARASPSSYLIVIWNVIVGLFLGDPFPAWETMVGCALILVPQTWHEHRTAMMTENNGGRK